MTKLPRVTNTATGTTMGLAAFKKHLRSELELASMTKQEVLDTKLVKAKDFDAFCERYNIEIAAYRGRLYVNRQQVGAALSNLDS